MAEQPDLEPPDPGDEENNEARGGLAGADVPAHGVDEPNDWWYHGGRHGDWCEDGDWSNWDYGWSNWGQRDWNYGWWGHTTSWQSSTASTREGRLSDEQIRQFNVADVAATTAMRDGRWFGADHHVAASSNNDEEVVNPRSTEKLTVPEFSGEGSDGEVGKSARSYIRRIQAWVRSTKLPPQQRALALYSALKERAWVYAEELDIDRLGSDGGMAYYLDWIQTRFMEVEVSKISQMMSDLFRRCKRRSDQSVRDFNVEFERMVLRLHEVRCDLPPLVKAWLYLDKLRLTEQEELALLSSVGNEYDVRRLQQAALIQDKTLRRGGYDKVANGNNTKFGGRWTKSIHLTTDEVSSEDEEGIPIIPEDDLIDEETAFQHHTAFMAYQGAKAKYREATRGRGTDPTALQRASEERLKLAKQRSYCSVCKRRGHWHKDAECPANQQKKGAPEQASQSAQMCYFVYMTEDQDSRRSSSASALAIVDTACTRSVAGYGWFENYYKMADEKGIPVKTVDLKDTFKFGASTIFESNFAVWAWFAIEGRWFAVRVSIVQCDVPLLLSRSVLAGLKMKLDVAEHKASLAALHLQEVRLATSATGHPALNVSKYPIGEPPLLGLTAAEDVYIPELIREGYMTRAAGDTPKTLFYPKKIPKVIQNFLEEKGTLSGASFFAWWKTANQSRDFWIETDSEMIRIHVCPRKDLFDPSKWNTTLTSLKESLLSSLTGRRITEAIPCLNEGTQVENMQDDFMNSHSDVGWHGPWIGRSRFEKLCANHCPTLDRSPDAQEHVAMEHAKGRVGDGPSQPGCADPRKLDGTRAARHFGGADQGRESHRADRDTGPGQDVPAAADRRVQEPGHRDARETDTRTPDAPASGSEEVARAHSDVLWAVQGLVLQRDPTELHAVGSGGDREEQGGEPRPGALCEVGRGGAGYEGAQGISNFQPGKGSGGLGLGPTTCDGSGLRQQHLEPGDKPKFTEGTPRLRDGGGPAIRGPPEGDADVGAPLGRAETDGEEQEHALREPMLVVKDTEKYGFLVNEGDPTDPKADSDEFEFVVYEEASDGIVGDDISDVIKNDQVSEMSADVNPFEVTKYDKVDEESPRRKARRGQEKRKWDRMSLGQKAKRIASSQLHRLSEVLMVLTLALGSWTQEVIGDPLTDLQSVFAAKHQHQPSWNSVEFGRSPVDCLEIFAGHSKISGAFANKRRGVLQPRDLIIGHDLQQESERDEVFKDLYEHRPRMVWLAPPCKYWCAFSRLNYTPQERRRLRKREQALIKLVEEVIVFQRANHGLVVVENPRTSDLWNRSSLKRWYNDPEMHLAQVDLCTYGLESTEGVPMRKGLTLLTNAQEFAEEINNRCDGSHEHQRVQGRETSRTAVYPDDFAKAVVRSYDVWRDHAQVGVWSEHGPLNPGPTSTNFPTTSSGSTKPGGAHAGQDTPLPIGGDAISFKGKVNATVASLLKRVHQNLGHPPTRELIRHLKIGGADGSVIRAAEQMVCKTCESSRKPAPHKVAAPVVALDFNEVIAIDILWFDSAESPNHAALNVVDLASTYQVVIPLVSTKADDVGRALCAGWFRWAGVPKQLLVDLGSAFKGDFLTMMNERSVAVRSAAAQAHWQNGVAERHGETWKLIWAKVVEDYLVIDEEIEEAVAAVCDSKNSLRNRSGYSPRQWVFGVSQRLPGDLFDGSHELGSMDAASAEAKFGRLQTIKNGARAAFFQVQTKDAYQRAVNHKSRVKPHDFQIGDLAYIYREMKQGKSKKPAASWTGPATIIGKEGQNFWLARGGRCYLAAPEHLRTASPEEVGETLRLKMAMKEVKKLIEHEVSDEEDMEIDETYVPEDEEDVSMEAAAPQDGGRPNTVSPAIEAAASRELAIRRAAKRNQLLDDVPAAIKKPRQEHQQAFMMKRCISQKGKEKQLEKELPWGMIPPDERPLYREAEEKQWAEHVEYGAVRPLTLEESAVVEATVSRDRILNSRFAYRDKNYAKRKGDANIPPKPKARLCIAGQWDPDLGVKDLATDAPTVSRQSVILALQLALARSWVASVGDIRAAFLNGIPAPRKLYFRQPRGGIPSLQAGQLVEVLKGVFGLSTSPKLWWTKLSTDLKSMKIRLPSGKVLFIHQNPIDPCIFMLVDEEDETVRGLLLTHVDDLMLLTEAEVQPIVHAQLKEKFPIDEWEVSKFEYVGCEFEYDPEYVKITQLNYARNRVDKVSIQQGQLDSDLANREQVEENRTSIGSLSWLSKQTRPDLQFAVSQAQKTQNAPTIGHLKATNKIVDMAGRHHDCGLTLWKIPEKDLVIMAYHDAAWGNTTLEDDAVPRDEWHGDHQVASQLGALVVAADRRALENEAGRFSLLHWQSKGCRRVCRSTFAGETMACSDAVECGLFLRGLLVSMKLGRLVPEEECGRHIDFHCITDCKSLYDHVHREGTPKAPADKRLAIDLAALRQSLAREGRHQWEKQYNMRQSDLATPERPCRPPLHWLPTGEQLADILTKFMRADSWWSKIHQGTLALPLRASQGNALGN